MTENKKLVANLVVGGKIIAQLKARAESSCETFFGEGVISEELGMLFSVFKNPNLGNLCGYVGVFADHPLVSAGPEKVSNALNEDEVPHGGITYARDCLPRGLNFLIPGPCWWFGFDAAHSGDLLPLRASFGSALHASEVYRDKAFMINECKKLAAGLFRLSEV